MTAVLGARRPVDVRLLEIPVERVKSEESFSKDSSFDNAGLEIGDKSFDENLSDNYRGFSGSEGSYYPTTNLKILVSNSVCGHIIGKQGRLITQLEFKSGARIHIAPENSVPPGFSERLVTIAGSLEASQHAHYLIADFIHRATQQKLSKLSNVEEISDDCVVTKILIPEQLVGFLIGKSGNNINDMQTKTGSKVTILNENDPRYSETERVVVVSGTLEGIVACQHMISKKLSSVPLTPKQSPESTHRKSFVAGNFPSTRLGSNIDSSSSGAYPMYYPSSPSSPYSCGTYSTPMYSFMSSPFAYISPSAKPSTSPSADVGLRDADREPSTLASIPLHSPTASQLIITPTPMGCYYGTEPYDLASLGLFTVVGTTLDISTNSYSLTAMVPTQFVGFVIGKGGSSVKEMQLLSGAVIEVVNPIENPSGNPYRTMTLTGTYASVQTAQMMILGKLLEGRYLSQGQQYVLYPESDEYWPESPSEGADPYILMIEKDFFVENCMVGYIIGKSGATINEIEQISGAKIHVSKPDPQLLPESERKVVLKGPHQAVMYAEELLKNKIEEGHFKKRQAAE